MAYDISAIKRAARGGNAMKNGLVRCMYNGEPWKIVRVGSARVTLVHDDGRSARVDPHYIYGVTAGGAEE